jgi:hypothetical protein
MKKSLFAGILLIGLVLSSCGWIIPPYDVDFINNSRSTVSITDLQNASLTAFDLAVNETKTVSIDSDLVDFKYTPGNLVKADMDLTGFKKTVTFTDR